MSISVDVRMYRQGFGDCFLLTITEDSTVKHMLIDCGVHQKVTGGAAQMVQVVTDISNVTSGHLDLVAVTHDHVDHQSGFQQAKSLFAQMTIGKLWLAWTENQNDPFAAKILADRTAKVKALTAFSSGADEVGLELSAAVQETLGFLDAAPGANGESPALAALRTQVGEANIEFHEQSEAPLTIEGLSGLRWYVLGPPRDEAIFLKSGPMDSGSDMYVTNAMPGADASFLAAALNRVGVVQQGEAKWDEVTELSYPFNQDQRLNCPLVNGLPTVSDGVSPTVTEFFRTRYCTDKAEWRRIDQDWTAAASELAMAVGDNINNTSLVLALEFVESGKVLLFVGDAQIENWMSWKDCKWSVDRDGNTVEVSASDLLARTVFYKVGHHGSRNATAKDDGLEQMKSRDLVALIPVDPVFAQAQKWQHPWPNLVTALEQKTSGRVAQQDPGAANTLSSGSNPQLATNLTVTPLYIEYTVTG